MTSREAFTVQIDHVLHVMPPVHSWRDLKDIVRAIIPVQYQPGDAYICVNGSAFCIVEGWQETKAVMNYFMQFSPVQVYSGVQHPAAITPSPRTLTSLATRIGFISEPVFLPRAQYLCNRDGLRVNISDGVVRVEYREVMLTRLHFKTEEKDIKRLLQGFGANISVSERQEKKHRHAVIDCSSHEEACRIIKYLKENVLTINGKAYEVRLGKTGTPVTPSVTDAQRSSNVPTVVCSSMYNLQR